MIRKGIQSHEHFKETFAVTKKLTCTSRIEIYKWQLVNKTKKTNNNKTLERFSLDCRKGMVLVLVLVLLRPLVG